MLPNSTVWNHLKPAPVRGGTTHFRRSVSHWFAFELRLRLIENDAKLWLGMELEPNKLKGEPSVGAQKNEKAQN